MDQLSRAEFTKHIGPEARNQSMYVEDMRRFVDAFETARAVHAPLFYFYIPSLTAIEIQEVGSLPTNRKCDYIRIEKRELTTEEGAKTFWVIRAHF